MFKIAVTGCGRISERHMNAIVDNADFTLAGVCDSVQDRASEYGRKFNVPYFTTQEQMLTETGPDVVSICTPSGTHPGHGIEAARHGAHVIVEKPMATGLEEADALISACSSNSVKLFVVKQTRFNPAIRLLKKAVEKKRFGSIYLVNATVRWQRPQEYFDAAGWRGTKKLDGGAFMNQASHYVDLVSWLAGPVHSVVAKTATLGRKIETEDIGAAVIRFTSGALGVIEVNMLTYPKNFEGSITVIGEKGTAKIGGSAMNSIEAWLFAQNDPDDDDVERIQDLPKSAFTSGHGDYYANVAAALKGECEPETDGFEGRKSLELLVGIYASAQKGAEVVFPL